ncbi:MAG: PPOX class F420-dependent oxidoreductase [Solirubrobacteraceae bacterium]
MAALHPDARALLDTSALVHMITVNADGSPQVSCVWAGVDGDDVVTAHLFRSLKVRNLQRDPRVSLSIEGTGLDRRGLREYLVVHGQARIEEGGAAELLQRLAHVYLGPEVRFPPMADPPAGYLARITPERLGGVGPWTS